MSLQIHLNPKMLKKTKSPNYLCDISLKQNTLADSFIVHGAKCKYLYDDSWCKNYNNYF